VQASYYTGSLLSIVNIQSGHPRISLFIVYTTTVHEEPYVNSKFPDMITCNRPTRNWSSKLFSC